MGNDLIFSFSCYDGFMILQKRELGPMNVSFILFLSHRPLSGLLCPAPTHVTHRYLVRWNNRNAPIYRQQKRKREKMYILAITTIIIMCIKFHQENPPSPLYLESYMQ